MNCSQNHLFFAFFIIIHELLNMLYHSNRTGLSVFPIYLFYSSIHLTASCSSSLHRINGVEIEIVNRIFRQEGKSVRLKGREVEM